MKSIDFYYDYGSPTAYLAWTQLSRVDNDKFQINYNFSYDRDLKFSNYDAITAKLGINKVITTFDYITENHELGDSEILTNNTEIKFSNEHSFKFDTTKDLKDDFTQFYKLATQSGQSL